MIKIIIKLIEFFLNSGLIPSQKDQMPQKIFPMLTKIMFENIKREIKLLFSMSTSIQVLHQQIRGVGVYVSADSADAGGGPILWKTY